MEKVEQNSLGTAPIGRMLTASTRAEAAFAENASGLRGCLFAICMRPSRYLSRMGACAPLRESDTWL